jgi:hypothetical protein
LTAGSARAVIPAHARRVRFNPSLPLLAAPAIDNAPAAPILRAVYSARVARSAQALNTATKTSLVSGASATTLSAASDSTASSQPINVAGTSLKELSSDERALVDQLQYVLDGIFPASSKANRQGANGVSPVTENDNALLFESLGELAALFLQMSPDPVVYELSRSTLAGVGGLQLSTPPRPDSMLRKLGAKRGILSTVVTRLLALRARSTPVALLVGTIMLVLARSDATESLFDKPEIAALVDAFFHILPALAVAQMPAASNAELQPHRPARVGLKNQPRRRGRMARRFDSKPQEDTILPCVRALLLNRCGVDLAVVSSVTKDARGVALVFGLALAAVLETSERSQVVMADCRRVHKVTAILFEAQKLARVAVALSDPAESSSTLAVVAPVASVALRVLLQATRNEVCKTIAVNESRIMESALAVMAIHQVKSHDNVDNGDRSKKDSPLVSTYPDRLAHDESAVTNALKLCINLTQQCPVGLKQFLARDGVPRVLDLLGSPLIRPRRRNGKNTADKCCFDAGVVTWTNCETFDVRVAGIVLLSSIVEQDIGICSSFQHIFPRGVAECEGGALAFVLELLTEVGKESDEIIATGFEPNEDNESVVADISLDRKNELSKERALEQRVMAGYLCFLLGSLVKGCPANRTFATVALADQSLDSLADALDEFRAFQHELGVMSSRLDSTYTAIISSLRMVDDGLCNLPSILDGQKAVETQLDNCRLENGNRHEKKSWANAYDAEDVAEIRQQQLRRRLEEHDDVKVEVVDETDWCSHA